MKKLPNLIATAFLFLTAILTSCEKSVYEPPQTFDLEITRPNRDSFFVINPAKTPFQMIFTLESDLSHFGALSWSPDSLSTDKGGIAISPGKNTAGNILSESYTSKVYVRYRALNDSTTGNVKIKITIP